MSQQDAAIKAGYAPEWARMQAHKLTTYNYIMDRIMELHEKIESKAIMKPKERKEILSEIGRGKLTDFIDPAGQPKLDENTPHGRAAGEYIVRETYNKQGDPVITKSIKLHNPITAIDSLNKMEHIYQGEGPGPGGVHVAVNQQQVNFTVLDQRTQELTERLLRGERTGGHEA